MVYGIWYMVYIYGIWYMALPGGWVYGIRYTVYGNLPIFEKKMKVLRIAQPGRQNLN